MKNLLLCLSIIFTLGVTVIPDFFASENHDTFSFNIQGPNNQRDNSRFRGATTKSVPWSVYVSSSNECENMDCLTRFWLELENGKNVAGTVNVGVGDRKTQKPYDSASKTDVYLTGEDNDVGTNSYVVKGDWDEEWS